MPKNIPAELFPSKRLTSSAAISVAPVLSPDNYMKRVPDFLRSAKKSILIEQQYIRSEHPEVVILLDAIKAARQKNPALDVRIVLGKLFAAKDVPKEKKNLDTLRTTYGLRLRQHIRYIPVNRFVHCHNKLVIVDGTAVLVSSQNWSRTGGAQNREAGVLVWYPERARDHAKNFVWERERGPQKMRNPRQKAS